LINRNFGSFERFKKEFSATALSTEGSGWAILAYDIISDRLMLIQIEKHNVNLIPTLNILLVLDIWEHAYYLDYKNDRAKYIENFWDAVNWDEVNNRI
jgi:Fe-Mn family superoxide dismutase